MSFNIEDLRSIELSLLLRDKNIQYDVFIEINNKIVKLVNSSDGNSYDRLLKYKGKLDTVFLTKEGFTEYRSARLAERKKLLQKQQNRSTTNALKMIKEDEDLLKDILGEVGVDSMKIELIDQLSEANQIIIEKTPTLSSLLKSLTSLDDKILVKKQLINYIAANILQSIPELGKFSIDKFNLALLICDLTLNNKEYWKSFQPKELIGENKNILNHGFDVVELLPNDRRFITPDIINFIQTHHEKPDGSGYPRGLNHSNLNIYNAIYTIVEDYVTQLIAVDFKSNKFSSIQNKILYKYKKYAKGKSSIFFIVLDAFEKFCVKNNEEDFFSDF